MRSNNGCYTSYTSSVAFRATFPSRGRLIRTKITFRQTKRKTLKAPTAYLPYVEVVRAAATKYYGIYANAGKEAAAMLCPTLLIFSFGIEIFTPSSGNSSSRIIWARAMRMSPPLPLVTRPRMMR